MMSPYLAVPSDSRARLSLDRVPLILALLCLLAGAALTAPAFAQDEAEEPPEQAVIAPLAQQSLLLDSALAEDRIVVVGERGHILVSDDAGTSWTQKAVPTRATLTGVWFRGKDLGWAVGHDSVILRTTDGGEAWERVMWAPEEESPFLNVWFDSDEVGYAIGAYGSFAVTMDGGDTWDYVPVTEDDFQPHLNQIAEADDGTLFMAAEAGMIFRSDDRGETWTEVESPYQGSFFGVLPLDEGVMLVFGLRGHLYRTEDEGATWTEIETGTTSMLNQGIRLPDGRVVIVGLSGTVLVSTDGGRTFELRQQASRAGIQSVVRAGNSEDLVFVGEFGVRKVALSELFGE